MYRKVRALIDQKLRQWIEIICENFYRILLTRALSMCTNNTL